MRAGSLTVGCSQFCRRYHAEPLHQLPAKYSSWSKSGPSVRAVTVWTWCGSRHFARLRTKANTAGRSVSPCAATGSTTSYPAPSNAKRDLPQVLLILDDEYYHESF